MTRGLVAKFGVNILGAYCSSMMNKKRCNVGGKVVWFLLKDQWLSNNLMSVFLQEIIKDQVAKMYLWPKTLEVPIIDPSKYVSAFFL